MGNTHTLDPHPKSLDITAARDSSSSWVESTLHWLSQSSASHGTTQYMPFGPYERHRHFVLTHARAQSQGWAVGCRRLCISLCATVVFSTQRLTCLEYVHSTCSTPLDPTLAPLQCSDTLLRQHSPVCAPGYTRDAISRSGQNVCAGYPSEPSLVEAIADLPLLHSSGRPLLLYTPQVKNAIQWTCKLTQMFAFCGTVLEHIQKSSEYARSNRPVDTHPDIDMSSCSDAVLTVYSQSTCSSRQVGTQSDDLVRMGSKHTRLNRVNHAASNTEPWHHADTPLSIFSQRCAPVYKPPCKVTSTSTLGQNGSLCTVSLIQCKMAHAWDTEILGGCSTAPSV